MLPLSLKCQFFENFPAGWFFKLYMYKTFNCKNDQHAQEMSICLQIVSCEVDPRHINFFWSIWHFLKYLTSDVILSAYCTFHWKTSILFAVLFTVVYNQLCDRVLDFLAVVWICGKEQLFCQNQSDHKYSKVNNFFRKIKLYICFNFNSQNIKTRIKEF